MWGAVGRWGTEEGRPRRKKLSVVLDVVKMNYMRTVNLPLNLAKRWILILCLQMEEKVSGEERER